ncbi:ninja-family protein AFP2-like isoform X2 [Prosopis cineraria]|uniref:ninja-family protein AFP2-like isoform X2 n=1 Tax=Prosopis cineraria TaxID=364024 RepID=UPI00240FF141|nr:ninja-family protein AFP2-like isoform X2 [Prosopis cineraria]
MSQDNEETRRKAMETLSLQIDKYPRDLLRTFMSRDDTQQSDNAEPEAGSEEIELNLGLSLGGRFGVDKHAKKLGRSSSIVGTMPLVRENESTTPPTPSYPPLLRTSSLPTETEEEWRKRKELQTLRRMEAKRRRSEKQRNSKTERDGGEGRTELEGPKGNDWAFGLPMWASASSRQVVLSDVLAQGKAHGLLGGTAGFHGGGSSPGIPEMEGKPFQGRTADWAREPDYALPFIQERSNQDAEGSSGTKSNENETKTPSEVENLSRKPHHGPNRGREIGSNSMEDMPCVFTQGTGPNGKRIEGILYRYGRGQEVRIMCVCHGNFLSPAEFVRHAGGGDVAHPLRHIVVNPSSTPYL